MATALCPGCEEEWTEDPYGRGDEALRLIVFRSTLHTLAEGVVVDTPDTSKALHDANLAANTQQEAITLQ